MSEELEGQTENPVEEHIKTPKDAGLGKERKGTRLVNAAVAFAKEAYKHPVWILATFVFLAAFYGFFHHRQKIQSLSNEFNKLVDRANIIGKDLQTIDALDAEVTRERDESASILSFESEFQDSMAKTQILSTKLLELNVQSAVRQGERLRTLRVRLETCEFHSEYAADFSKRCRELLDDVVQLQELEGALERSHEALLQEPKDVVRSFREISDFYDRVTAAVRVENQRLQNKITRYENMKNAEVTNRLYFDGLEREERLSEAALLLCFAYVIAYIAIILHTVYLYRNS